MKFKVGDTIKMVRKPHTLGDDWNKDIGIIYKIVNVTDDGIVKVKSINRPSQYFSNPNYYYQHMEYLSFYDYDILDGFELYNYYDWTDWI